MTSPIPFDFDMACGYIRRNYPEIAGKITFIDSAQQDAYSKVIAWLRNNDPSIDNSLARLAADYYLSNAAMATAFANDERLLIINTRKPTAFFGDNTDVNLWFTFLHECGHLIVPGAHFKDATNAPSLQERNGSEIAADVFAIIHCISLDFIDRADIEKLQHKRKTDTWRLHGRALGHMTSHAIQAVFLDKNIDDYRDLTPSDIVRIARDSLFDLALPESELQTAKNMFARRDYLIGRDKRSTDGRHWREKKLLQNIFNNAAKGTLAHDIVSGILHPNPKNNRKKTP